MWGNVYVWRTWVKGTGDFFVLFLQSFRNDEIITKFRSYPLPPQKES